MEIFLELKKLRLLYYEEEKSHSTAQIENDRRSAHPIQRSNEFRHGYFMHAEVNLVFLTVTIVLHSQF